MGLEELVDGQLTWRTATGKVRRTSEAQWLVEELED